MPDNQFVIGVDYGTDSVRSVIINAMDGAEVAASVYNYPRWKKGLYCNAAANQFRQHPLDYIEGLEATIKDCIKQAGGVSAANSIKGISIDTTGSTPVAVDKTGTPLALLPEFAENPNTMFVLWKDHTAIKEADEINAHARKFDTNYLQYVGGIYSSEWFWAKLLHVVRADEQVRAACHSWVEHCDWMPFLLTGGINAEDIKRGRCAAGHKAIWAEDFGGLPPAAFFTSLDPVLEPYSNLFKHTYTSDCAAGKLSTEWAQRLGLSTDVVVGIGAIDAHVGAVGGQIEPYYLSKVIGTSTCDIIVIPKEDMQGKLVKGISGQVDGSVIPGMIGLEAGQAAFGDTYAWFKKLLSWPLDQLLDKTSFVDEATATKLKNQLLDAILPELNKQAALLPINEKTELALDWFNGRRTPDADPTVKGAISSLTLGSDAPRIFRALAEATCFGTRSIADRYVEEGIPVKGVIGIGGVAKKSPFIMQMMADVLNKPIRIHKFEHTCALGAAMFAAVVAGIYKTIEEAMDAMGTGFDVEYQPDEQKREIYEKRYQQYKALGAYISGTESK